MHLSSKNQANNDKFPMSLGNIIAGVNNGRYKNTATSDTAVDIGAIERAINKRFGDTTIQFTVHGVKSIEFRTKSNESGRAVVVQSFSNRYVDAYPERFSSIPLIKLEDEEWKEKFSEIAVFLMGLLEQESVKFWFEDLPTGEEVEEHVIRNPRFGQPP